MGLHRRGDRHRVHCGMTDDVTDLLGISEIRILDGELAAALRLGVAADQDLAVGRSVEITHEIGTPVAQSDYSHLDYQESLSLPIGAETSWKLGKILRP